MFKINGRKSIVIIGIFLIRTISALEINTDGQLGLVRTLSAQTFGKGTLNVGSGFTFSQSYDYLKGTVKNNSCGQVRDPNGAVVADSLLETARLFSSDIFLGVNPFSFLDLAVSLPLYYDWSGISNIHDGGIGDLHLSAKIKTPSSQKSFQQSFYIAGTLPVGMKNNGLFPRHSFLEENKDVNPTRSFYSANTATLTGELLLTFDIGALQPKIPVQIHTNFGGSITASSVEQRNLINANLAIEYVPVYFLSLFVDVSGESRLSNLSTGIKPIDDPVLLSPGFRISTPAGLYLFLAGDFSLSSKQNSARTNWKPVSGSAKGYEYSTGVVPSYGAQFIFGWNGFMTVQDDDKDGIKNSVDRCPKDAEDFDGFQDEDGCPDPDNDNDGILDIKDKCPNIPEDIDGFEDTDGCPDPDNDNDGIIDIKDKCPNAPEDIDGFEDTDGCPDLDNDKDGIPDSLDKCPNIAEDFDGFEDTDGCPDLDNDKDGIPDSIDKCPNVAETFNNFQDDDGCPDSVVKVPDLPSQQILQGLQFRNNGPELTFGSYQYIEPLIKKLKEFPSVEIEIRGYVDSLGDYTKNMHLTQMRAEAVRQYMISKGIDSRKIRAVGFGASNPIADNRTAAGRSQNRRLEVIRVK